MNCDFSKYSFQHYENAINIGWNRNNRIKQESCDREFLEKLKCHCSHPINVDYNGKYREIEQNGQKLVSGFGEIRILDLKNEIRYAAPNIIYEEIKDGFYIPPTEFVEAVKTSPLPYDEQYSKFMERYLKECYWGESEERVKKVNSVLIILEKGKESFCECIQDRTNLELVTHKGSLLNYAITERKEEIAILLIHSDIDINMFEGVELLSAIENGFTSIADMLIEKNIVMDSSELKVNPLVNAIKYHNNYIAKKLIQRKPELIVSYTNEYVKNCTILDVAKRYKNEEIVKLL